MKIWRQLFFFIPRPQNGQMQGANEGKRRRKLTVNKDNWILFKMMRTFSTASPFLIGYLKGRAKTGIFKKCADLICIPIRDIFNQSISQGIFPDDWKCAKVTPLFKQSDRDDLNNYLPISPVDFSCGQGLWENLLWSILRLPRRAQHHL